MVLAAPVHPNCRVAVFRMVVTGADLIAVALEKSVGVPATDSGSVSSEILTIP
jgi:hypothetical protein